MVKVQPYFHLSLAFTPACDNNKGHYDNLITLVVSCFRLLRQGQAARSGQEANAAPKKKENKKRIRGKNKMREMPGLEVLQLSHAADYHTPVNAGF